jgi:aspartyl-tRNA(Asn)/glutamyl-tRNA(Gln) amidotransferase subunit A
MSEDILNLSLTALAASIARREVTSESAVQACLDRIALWQPSRNCFVEVNGDAALEQARACDRHLAAGGKAQGSMFGVPLAHKDMFYRPGVGATGGTEIRRDWIASTTATALSRIDQEGAIQLGRLSMSEFAAGPTGHNIHYGHCRNAYNRDHISGGSSSGSGVAVSARLAYGALGSDTGGSVRLPAAVNGVLGLKPTYGRVSRYGAMPRSWSLDHVGVLARTASDCAVLMNAIAGPDKNDSTASSRPVPDYRAALGQSIKGLRVGVPSIESLGYSIEPEVVTGLEASLAVLRDLGAIIVPVQMPDMRSVFFVAETIVKCEAATMHRDWLKSRPEDYSPQVRSRIEAGLTIPATYYLDAMRLRKQLTEQFLLNTMANVDMLQMPVMCGPVPSIAETDIDGSGDKVRALISRLTTLTRPINLFGLPSISIPCGFDPLGLPLSFQLVGFPFSEADLLNVAHAYQGLTDFHLREPTL